MSLSNEALEPIERGQQLMRENIADSARMIDETRQRVATSRLFTANESDSSASDEAGPHTELHG